MPETDTPDERKKTRVRSGCLTCRKRRRKCDEGKPHCQNCLDRSLECAYGLWLNFRESTTLQNAPRLPQKRRYNTIEFVECTEPTTRDSTGRAIPTRHSEDTEGTPAQTCPDEANNGNDELHEEQASTTAYSPKSRANPSHSARAATAAASTPLCGLEFEEENQISRPWPDSNTDVGLSDLNWTHMDNMALYNDLQTVASTSHTRNPAPPSAPILHYSVGSRWHGPPGDTAMPCTINTIHPESAVKAYSIHDTERLDLLRYYRYNVAPWLDIADDRLSFSLVPLLLCKHSAPLENIILALASLHRSLRQIGHEDDPSNAVRFFNLSNQLTGIDQVLEPSAFLSQLFVTAYLLLSSSPDQWSTVLQPMWSSMSKLTYFAFANDMTGSVFWTCLRFDIAQAFAAGSRISLPIIRNALGYGCTGDVNGRLWRQEMAVSSLQGLLLVAVQVLETIHAREEPDSNVSYRPFHELWRETWQNLQDWHAQTPMDLWPLFERPCFEPNIDFPIIVFTTSSARLATQLYHFLVYLLLNSKPRTLLLTSDGDIVLSALWHARRVCAIAESNRQTTSWDLMMIPMLEVVARHLTHESQQSSVLDSLDYVRRMLGWKVEGVVGNLRATWALS